MKKAGFLMVLLLSAILIMVGCGGSTGTDGKPETYSLTVQTVDGGESIADVTISIAGNDITNTTAGTTGSDGRLSLTDLSGTVTISAAHEDYVFAVRNVTKSNAGQTIELNCDPYVALSVERTTFGPSYIFEVSVETTSQIEGAARFTIRDLDVDSKSFGETLTRNTESDSMDLYILDSENNVLETLILSEDTLDLVEGAFSGNISIYEAAATDVTLGVSLESLEFGETIIYRAAVERELVGAESFALMNEEGELGPITPVSGKASIYSLSGEDITLVVFDRDGSIMGISPLTAGEYEKDIKLTAAGDLSYTQLSARNLSNFSIQADSDVLGSAELSFGDYRRWVPLTGGSLVDLPEGIFIMNDVAIEYDFAFVQRSTFNDILTEKLIEVDYNLGELDLYFRIPGFDLIDAKTGQTVSSTTENEVLGLLTTLYDVDYPNGRTVSNAMADVEVEAIAMDTQNIFRVTVYAVTGIDGVEGFTIFEPEEGSIAELGSRQDNYTEDDFVTLYIMGQSSAGSGEYSVTFNVNSVTEGEEPISEAHINFAGLSGYTDTAGTKTFTGIEEGTHEYTITAGGYTQITDSVEVTDDTTVQIYMSPVPEVGNRVHFSGILFYDEIQQYWTEIPYVANGHYNEYGLDTDDFVGSGDYHRNSLAFPNAVDTTFDGIAIDEGTRLIIYSQENFTGQILLDVYGPKIINNVTYEGSSQVSDYLTKTFSPPELNDNFPPETRTWSNNDMHQWSYGSCRIRTSSDPDYHDDFEPLATGENDIRVMEDLDTGNPAGI